MWREVTAGKSEAPGAAEVLSQNWIEALPASESETEKLLGILDRGEAEALALAQTLPNALLLIDERRGRRVAENLGIRRVGTLGLMVMAKESGFIDRIRPEVEKLAAARIYMRKEIVEAVLKSVGE